MIHGRKQIQVFEPRFHISWGEFLALRGSSGGFLDDYRGIEILQESNLLQTKRTQQCLLLLVITGNAVSDVPTQNKHSQKKQNHYPSTMSSSIRQINPKWVRLWRLVQHPIPIHWLYGPFSYTINKVHRRIPLSGINLQIPPVFAPKIKKSNLKIDAWKMIVSFWGWPLSGAFTGC